MPNKRAKRTFLVIAAILGAAASTVKVLDWMGIRIRIERPSGINQSGDQSVASQNQSGGITAGTVNVVPVKPPRHLTETIEKQLVDKLKACGTSRIKLYAVIGDRESVEFAQEIESYLAQNGYESDGLNIVMRSVPPVGVGVECKQGNPSEITVGVRG